MKLITIIINSELFALGNVLIYFDNPATLLILDINNQPFAFLVIVSFLLV